MEEDIRKERTLRDLAAKAGIKIKRVVNGVIETEDGKFYVEGDKGLSEITQAEAEERMKPQKVEKREKVPV